ncbi:MAG: glycosyl transferase family 2 [Marinibacterium sp.]|nr:glycosyl transferase family 2 [Marinibacterium sp.]
MTAHMPVGKNETATSPDLSVLVVAEGDGQGLVDLIGGYRAALDGMDLSYEVLLLFDHAAQPLAALAQEIAQSWPQLDLSPQRPWTDDDTALRLGIKRAAGGSILVLPGWPEIDPAGIPDLVAALDDADMVAAERQGLALSGWHRLRSRMIQGMLGLLFKTRIRDVFCRARAGQADAMRKVSELGVRQHFLPVVAMSEGYHVAEVPVSAVPDPDGARVYRFKPLAHISALVDILTLYVGLKFLKRPLRFFGSVGVPMILLGSLAILVVVLQRLFFETALADRPAMVFAVMLLVLGIQIVALGLVGEIIIFASSRRIRDYEIDTIIRGRLPEGSEALDPAPDPAMGELGETKL